MSHNITHRIKRGSFIEYSLSGIKRSSFKVIKRELSSVLKNKKGIYALYDGKKLVRVGLATNIYWRVKGHSKNEKIKWDNATLFIIRNEMLAYLRDLETVIVRIAKPKYNQQKGRIGDDYYLEKILRRAVKKKREKMRDAKIIKDAELDKLEEDIERIEEVIKK